MKLRIPRMGVVAALGLLLGAALLAPTYAEARGVRGSTRTSVNRGASRNVNRGASQNVNRDVNRNVNRDVNRDIDRDYDRYGGYRDVDVDVDRDYHPVAGAAAVAVTAAAVGSVVYSLPPSCSTTVVGGVTYQECGGSYYQPQYSGSQVNYVVVEPPR